MTLQRTLQLLPVFLITLALTLPASTDGDRTGTIVLENQGTRAVWFAVHEQERRISVYPWGLEGYRRITAGRSLPIEGTTGDWTVVMENARGDVEFTVTDKAVLLRFDAAGEDLIKTSVHRDGERMASHDFEKQKSSTAVGAQSHSTNHTPYKDRNRKQSNRDQTVTKLRASRTTTRPSPSHNDGDHLRIRSYSTSFMDRRRSHSRYRRRYRSRHIIHRRFRHCSPFTMFKDRHHDGFHRYHRSRYRFGVRFQFDGHHRKRYHHNLDFRHHGIRLHFR